MAGVTSRRVVDRSAGRRHDRPVVRASELDDQARISECSVQAAWGMSAGQTTASPAAIRVRSSPTPTQPPPSMTMNVVVFGLEWGSIRRVAGERQLRHVGAAVGVDDRPGQADGAGRSVWPAVADPEPADLDRHRAARPIAAGAAALPATAAGALLIVASGSAKFCRVK